MVEVRSHNEVIRLGASQPVAAEAGGQGGKLPPH